MKKFIFSLFALAALLLAGSCQRENLEPVEQGGTVTYTVQVPGALATKAAGDYELIYEVYRQAQVGTGADPIYEGKKTFSGNSVDLPLEFVKGQNFVVLFWAQKEGLTAYNTGNLRNVTLNSGLTANQENYEVFAGNDLVENCASKKGGNVVLFRPIAQLNIATLTSGLTLGNTSTVKPESSDLKVTGLYSAYNVATGEVSGNAGEVSYAEAAIKANDIFNSDYTRVGMNYVGFMPKEGANVEVDFNIYTEKDGDISHKVSNVPVKANYKTNIIGNLITATDNYQVTLGAWGTPDTNVEVVEVSTAQDLQKAIENIQPGAEGNIILEGDIDLGALFGASTLSVTKAGNAQLPIVIPEGKTMTLDLNGFIITTPWEDETAGKHYYAFDNKGTLNIVDSKVKGQIVARGNFNYGKMTLESGTITACDGNGGYGVRNYEGAEFVMNGGTVATLYEDGDKPGEGYDACPIRVDQGAKAVINGGIINNVSNFTVAIDNYGETIVNDGTFTSVHTTVANSASMTINGGSFTCNGLEGITAHALWAAAGTTTINGGTFNGKDNYNGFNVDASKGATVYIKGGEFLPVHSGSLYGEGTIIVKGGTFFDQVPAKYLAAGYSCQQNEEGKWIVPQVALAKIGEVSYPTLAAAIDAVSEDAPATITVQAAVFTDESIVIPAGKSITLDLNRMTIIGEMHKDAGAVVKNNGTLTIKNGTVSSTAANGGSAILNNGTLVVENTTLNGAPNAGGSWPSYTVNNTAVMTATNTKFTSYHGSVSSYGEGAVVTLNESEIHMAGIPGFTSHGIYTYSSGKVVVNGGTYANNATDQASSGASVINGHVEVNAGTFTGRIENYYGTPVLRGGTYSVKPNEKFLAEGYKAVQNAQTGKWEVEEKTYVAQIGEEQYESLQEAVENATNGATITFLADIEQVDGVLITDKNLTVDLNYKTFTVTNGANTNNRNFKINGSSVVTIKNGTMVAAGEYSSGAYGTVRTEGTANVTLTDVKLYNYRGNGLNVKALSGTTVTISDTEVYSQYGGGIESAGGTIELTNVKVEQKGMYTAPYNSMAISVNGGGTVTVNSGTYSTECITAEDANNQGTSHGPWCAGVLNSGGTLIIKGGTFSNDNFGENSLATYARGLLLADTAANIQIEGGIFNALKAIVDVTNNLGDASRNPSVTLAGGDFSADPRVSGLYASHLISVVEGKDAVEDANGRWTLVKVQQNNEIWYVSDEMALVPTNPDAINATVVSNVWDKTTGKGVITFDDRLTTIGEKAFQRVTNATPSNWATSISLPEGVETIGNYAFAQCYSLTTITIPNTVTAIGEYAFQSCDAVTSVTIGSGVTEIGSSAFYNCYEIKEIVCKSNTPPALADKWVFSGVDKTAKVIVPAGSVDEYKADAFWSSFTNIVAE